MRGEAHSPYDAVYGAYMNRQRMVIEGDYKLMVYPTIGVQRLYNVATDPYEMDDLAAKPEHAGTIARLMGSLEELKRGMGDPMLAKGGK